MEKQFLEKVYGYKEIKGELKRIQDWYFNSENLGERKKLLPKGILFHGEPGEGKTHLVREYAKSFNYPIFVIEGNDDNVLDEIVKTYEKATKEKNAIIVIDEIDKLIKLDDKLTRIIMAQLDGYKTLTVLTLATCNFYSSLPDALLREGRFDRRFCVSVEGKDDLLDMIKGFSKDAGIALDEANYDELIDVFTLHSASFIRATFNNAALRFGDKCNVSDIINVADFLDTGFIQKNDDFELSRNTAIHEAGHAVYKYLFCNTLKFLRVYFDNNGGKTVYSNLNACETKESRLETIRGALAGVVAEDIVFKSHEIGCAEDLEKAYLLSYRLLNRTCISGVKNYCSEHGFYIHRDNTEHLNKMDRQQ